MRLHIEQPLARIAGEGAERSEAGEGILSSVLPAATGSICAAIKSERGPPMTLGNAAESRCSADRLVSGRGDQVEPNPSNSSSDTAPTRRSSIGVSGFEQFSQERLPS